MAKAVAAGSRLFKGVVQFRGGFSIPSPKPSSDAIETLGKAVEILVPSHDPDLPEALGLFRHFLTRPIEPLNLQPNNDRETEQ